MHVITIEARSEHVRRLCVDRIQDLQRLIRVEVLYSTGIRNAELRGLMLADFDAGTETLNRRTIGSVRGA